MHRWVAVMLLFSGCAYGLSGPDPDRPRGKPPNCDTSKALVALDGLMAGVSGVVALSLAQESEPAVALLPLSIGAIYAGGALRGNTRVNKCREAMSEYESYASARDTLGAHPQPEYADEREPAVGAQPHGETVRGPSAPVASAAPLVPPAPGVAVAPAPTAAPPTAAPPTAAPVPTAPTPVAAAPAPVAAPPPAPTAKAPSKAPAKKAPPKHDDDWSDFWREVE
ncbi:MAG TPA: hypothetical protein VIV40_12750 [Kofleriaceae bacterium]